MAGEGWATGSYSFGADGSRQYDDPAQQDIHDPAGAAERQRRRLLSEAAADGPRPVQAAADGPQPVDMGGGVLAAGPVAGPMAAEPALGVAAPPLNAGQARAQADGLARLGEAGPGLPDTYEQMQAMASRRRPIGVPGEALRRFAEMTRAGR